MREANDSLRCGPAMCDDTRLYQAELKAVGRHVGNMYSHSTDLFELIRPA